MKDEGKQSLINVNTESNTGTLTIHYKKQNRNTEQNQQLLQSNLYQFKLTIENYRKFTNN